MTGIELLQQLRTVDPDLPVLMLTGLANDSGYDVQVRVVTDSSRRMAAALAGTDDIESVSIGEDGELTVLSRNVTALQRSIPRLAQEQGIRLMRVEPLDDSLESIFSYVVDR